MTFLEMKTMEKTLPMMRRQRRFSDLVYPSLCSLFIRRRRRQLDDEDLDSGDDIGRDDRAGGDESPRDDFDEQALAVMRADIPRHAAPEPSDNEVAISDTA